MPDHPFQFGERVIADGDADNRMVVTSIAYTKDAHPLVQVSYWCNGDHKEVWIAAWRLKAA